MEFVWGAIWASVVLVVQLAAHKWYMPKLRIKYASKDTVDDITLPQRSLKSRKITYIIFLIFAAAVAAVCGYIAEAKEISYVDMFNIVVALSVLSVASLTDFEFYRIPNLCALVMLGARVISLIVEVIIYHDFRQAIINCVLGGLVASLFLYLMSKITRGGIGYGDVKIFGALGFLCGLSAIIYSLVFSFFSCAAASIILLIFRKKHLKDGVPLGPFIFIGFAITSMISLI